MFPNLKNKKFTDVSSNSVVRVLDQFENIAILDNKQRVDVNRLLDTSYYDEYIDPRDFFNKQNLEIFAEKIKSIPEDIINTMRDDESIVMTYDPEEEKRLLQEKIANMSNPVNEMNSQVDKFKSFMDEEDIPVVENLTQVNTSSIPLNTSDSINTSIYQEIKKEEERKEDPIIQMFRNVKRNTDFQISIDISDKIPRPDFIEMMEDSYNTSIIEYLSNEFTDKIIKDPSFIREKIKKEIEKIVYKKDQNLNSISNEVIDNRENSNTPEVKKRKYTRKQNSQ